PICSNRVSVLARGRPNLLLISSFTRRIESSVIVPVSRSTDVTVTVPTLSVLPTRRLPFLHSPHRLPHLRVRLGHGLDDRRDALFAGELGSFGLLDLGPLASCLDDAPRGLLPSSRVAVGQVFFEHTKRLLRELLEQIVVAGCLDGLVALKAWL